MRLFIVALVTALIGCTSMSHTYDGDPVFDTSITLPDDGDKLDAASVNVALEALADRAAYNREVWARIHTSGAGSAASIISGDGIASAAVVAVGGDYMIEATFANDFANANFAPVVSSLDGDIGYHASVDHNGCTASKVRITVTDNTGALVDVSSTLVRVSLHVRGER